MLIVVYCSRFAKILDMIIAIVNLQLMLKINFPRTYDYINNFVYTSFLFLNFVIIDCDRMGKFRLWLHSYDSVNSMDYLAAKLRHWQLTCKK